MHIDRLRYQASRLNSTGTVLQGAVALWHDLAWLAEPFHSTVGTWLEANQLATIVACASEGVYQFTGDLCQAHSDIAVRMTSSADNYDAAEERIIALVRRVDGLPIRASQGDTGPGTATRNDYQWSVVLPLTEAVPGYQTEHSMLTWQSVDMLLRNTNPESIGIVADAYRQLSSVLTDLTGEHAWHSRMLADAWEGRTAVLAVNHLRHLHLTAAGLQAQTWAVYRAMDWYSGVLQAFRRDTPRPHSPHAADVAAADRAARERMIALNAHIQTVRELMPPVITKSLPPQLDRI